jgi:hypothetical protein
MPKNSADHTVTVILEKVENAIWAEKLGSIKRSQGEKKYST